MSTINPHTLIPMTDSATNLLELVHTIMHQYRSLQYRILRDGPHDITHMDAKVLGFFAAHPGATQSDLVLHSGRDKAQLGRLIKGLREQGLLDGKSDDTDRRSVQLSLTKSGWHVQSELQKQATRLSAKAVAGLSPAQQRQLTELLQSVEENLSDLEARESD